MFFFPKGHQNCRGQINFS